MKLQYNGIYPMSGELYARMVCSRDFILQRFEEFAADTPEVTISRTPEEGGDASLGAPASSHASSAEITVRARMNAAALPAQARSYIGDNAWLTYTEKWDFASSETSRAACELHFDTLPATSSFTMDVREAEGQSRCAVDGKVEVKIPFFGPMVENLIIAHLGEFFAHDVRVATEWKKNASLGS